MKLQTMIGKIENLDAVPNYGVDWIVHYETMINDRLTKGISNQAPVSQK